MSLNRFVFIIPAFNASKTIVQCINSVIIQTYQNWKIFVIDDLSTDNTREIVKNYQLDPRIGNKLILIENIEKKWEVRNVVDTFQFCEPDDIVCRLDGDDWLCDVDALSIIDSRYKSTGCNVLWTAHRWDFSNVNISNSLPNNANPYEHPWVSSHFKTFRKNLVENVNDANFRGQDGEYFKRIGDQAVYLPVLSKSAGNWHFEPIVAYHYTIDLRKETFETDDAKFQRDEAIFLRRRGFVE